MSIASVSLLITAKVIANTSVTVVFSNPMWRRQRIPVGATYGTGVTKVAGFWQNANLKNPVVEFEARILHNLADPTDENTYKSGAMLTDMALLMDPSFYRVGGVRGVIGNPELEPPERIGNVYEYAVTVQLVIV